MNSFDRIWINTNLITFTDNGRPYGCMRDAAIACKHGQVSWLGSMDELENGYTANETVDLGGRWITPGFIDCHTHIIYGGNRAKEYEMRLQGADYEQIAQQGGGINSTVRMTRETSFDDLYRAAQKRAKALMADGVTTLEVKSGYGLSLEHERKMLAVGRRLNELLPLTVVNTFLGAHTVPPEYREQRRAYIDLLIEEILPRLHEEKLVDAVDGFCENIAFTLDEIHDLFTVAKSLGLPLKLHAEQLSNSGGAALAAKFRALSADHLEYLDEPGVKAMAANGTVAVLLPGAFYCLNESQVPPVELLREHRVPIAVASDSNPGSSPLLSFRLVTNMACRLFGLTPEEALKGVTINAAKALGLDRLLGSLEVGKNADFAVWDIEEPAELVYWIGGELLVNTVIAGIDQRVR